MFITNGKSLIGNIGLIISLLILVLLLVFSYNKCIMNNSIENFEIDDSDSDSDTKIPPKDLRIIINGNSLTINFSIDLNVDKPIPKKFMVILSQYDLNKKSTGDNKIFLSNEYEINTNIVVDAINFQTNLCSLVDGIPACSYGINNLDIRDAMGNPYYYKIGISAVYDTGNSNIITPYNINSKDKMFTLLTGLEKQNNEYTNFIEYQKANAAISANVSESAYNNTMATADGQYELIKSQLGNYPDNLLLDSQTVNADTLGDLIDKSMAMGYININVKAENTTPT
jgi:hypothetical protein